jgi:hypothetical protein
MMRILAAAAPTALVRLFDLNINEMGIRLSFPCLKTAKFGLSNKKTLIIRLQYTGTGWHLLNTGNLQLTPDISLIEII